MAEQDLLVFAEVATGDRCRLENDLFGMGGIAVATDGKIFFLEEPNGKGFRRIIVDETGPIGMSAKPFTEPEQDTIDNIFYF